MNFDFIVAMLIFGSSAASPPSVIQGFESVELCKAAIVDLVKQAPAVQKHNVQCVVMQKSKP